MRKLIFILLAIAVTGVLAISASGECPEAPGGHHGEYSEEGCCCGGETEGCEENCDDCEAGHGSEDCTGDCEGDCEGCEDNQEEAESHCGGCH